jgi:hypothetical protein
MSTRPIPAANSWRTPPSRPRGRLVAVRRRAILMPLERDRPQPRLPDGRCGGLHDAADYDVVGEHVVIIVAPLSGRSEGIRALKDDPIVIVGYVYILRTGSEYSIKPRKNYQLRVLVYRTLSL